MEVLEQKHYTVKYSFYCVNNNGFVNLRESNFFLGGLRLIFVFI